MRKISFLLFVSLLLSTPALAASCEIPRVKEPLAVPAPAAGELAVATQNLHRLFDDADDGVGPVLPTAEYRERLEKLARHVREVLNAPAVLAVQEAENLRVLEDLAAEISQQQPGLRYRAVLEEGNDRGGIDVGFLVRSDLRLLGSEPLMAEQRLALDGSRLYDRPPLLLRLEWAGKPLEVVVVHMRSLLGSESEKKGLRVAVKRAEQSEELAAWVRERLRRQPDAALLVLGDFNATAGTSAGVDVLAPLQKAGLKPLDSLLPATERYTFVYRCQAQALDHVLASPALQSLVTGLAASRGNAHADGRAAKKAGSLVGVSDHDGLVVYLRRPKAGERLGAR